MWTLTILATEKKRKAEWAGRSRRYVNALENGGIMATRAVSTQQKAEAKKPQIVEKPKIYDWSKPQAMAIPKEGYFSLEQGCYGPAFPRTPACYGFSVLAKVNPGREQAMRDYGNGSIGQG